MLNKKKTVSLLLLGASAAVAVLATNIYFSARSILKHIKINNKNDINQITPEEFKEKWEKEGLSFDSPIFQKYFNLEFKHAKANNVLKHLEFGDLKAYNNTKTLKFKLTYKKGYGKDEIKEFVLLNFKSEKDPLPDEIEKKAQEFLNSVAFTINDKNRLASTVNNVDNLISNISDPNFVLNPTLNFIPNDELGTLDVVYEIIYKPTNKKFSAKKAFSGFKKDIIANDIALGLNPVDKFKNGFGYFNPIYGSNNDNAIYKVADFDNKINFKIEGANITVNDNYFDSKIANIDEILNAKLNFVGTAKQSPDNIYDLILSCIISKNVIVGKNDDGSYKYKKINIEKEYTYSFLKALQENYKNLLKNKVFGAIKNKLDTDPNNAYDHNVEVNDFNLDTNMNGLKSLYENIPQFNVTTTIVEKYPLSGTIKINFKAQTNVFNNPILEVSVEETFTLNNLKTSLPKAEDLLKNLNIDFSDTVKYTAPSTLAFDGSKTINEHSNPIQLFKLTWKNTGEIFTQVNKYNWKVKTVSNDIDGKIYAKITATSIKDSNDTFSKEYEFADTQFRKYDLNLYGLIQMNLVGLKEENLYYAFPEYDDTQNFKEYAEKYLHLDLSFPHDISSVIYDLNIDLKNSTFTGTFKHGFDDYINWAYTYKMKNPKFFSDDSIKEIKKISKNTFYLNVKSRFSSFLFHKGFEQSFASLFRWAPGINGDYNFHLRQSDAQYDNFIDNYLSKHFDNKYTFSMDPSIKEYIDFVFLKNNPLFRGLAIENILDPNRNLVFKFRNLYSSYRDGLKTIIIDFGIYNKIAETYIGGTNAYKGEWRFSSKKGFLNE